MGLFLYTMFFKVVPQKCVTSVQIRKIRRPHEFNSSGLWIPQIQNGVLKVLLLDVKHFLSPLVSRSVLHKPHLVDIMVTLNKGDKTIFQNPYVSFSSHHAVNEHRDDYSVTEYFTSHSHSLILKIGESGDT